MMIANSTVFESSQGTDQLNPHRPCFDSSLFFDSTPGLRKVHVPLNIYYVKAQAEVTTCQSVTPGLRRSPSHNDARFTVTHCSDFTANPIAVWVTLNKEEPNSRR